MTKKLLLLFSLLILNLGFSQSISQYQYFNGNFDFTMIGNTMNIDPNGSNLPCAILTQSSAVLNLNPGQTVEAAYLYWSGSGSLAEADFNVELNGNPITAQRTFTTTMGSTTVFPFWGAFADVTSLVKITGNGTYLLSDLDITNVIPNYCPNGLNYAGWSILIVYEDPLLPNNVVSVYDGFQRVDTNNPNISITLNGLNVTNTIGAKVGFLIWEGDANIAVNEELRINGILVGNPPLNPTNNAFNCTNSFTGANDLWNMDLDYYSISNYISVGDTSMTFQIQTGQDVIIAHNFAVTLSSVFPDATIKIDEVLTSCGSREVQVNYTVYNTNGTTSLLANVPITFYAEGVFLGNSTTNTIIPIGGSESGSITLTIADGIDDQFTLKANVDDDGTPDGIVIEVDETNNDDETSVQLIQNPEINKPEDQQACDEDDDGKVYFDLTLFKHQLNADVNSFIVTYHESEQDAKDNSKRITAVETHVINSYSRKKIWVRITDPNTNCYNTTSFTLSAQKKTLSGLEQPIMICNTKDNPAIVNLNLVEWFLSKKISYLNELDLKYYLSQQDANLEINPIQNISTFKPTSFPYIIYLKVKGKNELWCDNIIEIQLNECIVPKGISPNGDGQNDAFDLEIFNLVELQIFNRYGTEVFKHGEGYTNQWRGQGKNGQQLPSGTYYYVFKTFFDTYIGYVYVMYEVRR